MLRFRTVVDGLRLVWAVEANPNRRQMDRGCMAHSQITARTDRAWQPGTDEDRFQSRSHRGRGMNDGDEPSNDGAGVS